MENQTKKKKKKFSFLEALGMKGNTKNSNHSVIAADKIIRDRKKKMSSAMKDLFPN